MATYHRGESNPHATLTAAAAAEIREQYATGDHTKAGLARLHGVTESAIRHIITGRRWATRQTNTHEGRT